MKRINLLIITLLTTLPFLAISQGARLKYADKMYSQGAYYYASEGYEDVLARKKDSSLVAGKLAYSYDKVKNVEKAVSWYEYIYNTGSISQEQLLRYALLQRNVGNYERSDQLLNQYTNKASLSEGLFNHPAVSTLQSVDARFDILSLSFNTRASEIGASFYGDNMIFSSNIAKRKAVGYQDEWSGNQFYDIYQATIKENGEIGKTKKLKAKKVNTKYHDGPVHYSEVFGYVYFTRNNMDGNKRATDGKDVSRLRIFRAKLSGNKFVNVEELSSINNAEYSTAHPFVSADGTKLFFSSDRPGGFGGMDIYSVNLDKNGMPTGTPMNLGNKVNTPLDEIFPTYNEEENLLFFSSEGHFGLGGLDVYLARLNADGTAKSITNLGAPINSSFDDFGFISNEGQTKGYFSSNRKNGLLDDDIYGFNQSKPYLNTRTIDGKVITLEDNSVLENAIVRVYDSEGNLIGETTSNSDGAYFFEFDEITDNFSLKVSKQDYVTEERTVTLKDKQLDYTEDFEVAPSLDYYFTGLIKDSDTGVNLDGVKITITDSKTGNVLGVYNTGKGGDFTSDIIREKYGDNYSYSVRLEKDGYITKTVSVEDVVALNRNINLNEKISLDMVVPKEGSTDLTAVVDLKPIYFDFNSSAIRPDAKIELDKVVQVMKDNPGMVITLRAHTDSKGDAAYNLNLSDKRAKSSMQYIVSQGIQSNRITAKGFGKSELVVSDEEIEKAATEEAKEALHQKNRRTEFIIVKMK